MLICFVNVSFFKVAAKRWRYEMLGISWKLHFQPIESLPAGDALGLPINPQYFIPRVSGCYSIVLKVFKNCSKVFLIAAEVMTLVNVLRVAKELFPIGES